MVSYDMWLAQIQIPEAIISPQAGLESACAASSDVIWEFET